MSSNSTTNQNNMCDYCHAKPKYGTFQYCGRTCSAQAAAISQASSVCKQCQQKPRFQNFEFCGKNCAATWQANNPGSNQNPPKPSKGSGKHANPPPPSGNNSQSLQPQSQNHSQGAPPAATGVNGLGQNPNLPQVPIVPPNVSNSMAPPVVPLQTQPQAAVVGNAPLPIPNNAVPVSSSTGVCLISGCGKPVYTAGASQSSEYCSQRHREEAVTSGLVQPCIMCHKLPRSAADHFCSKACRDKALAP